MTSRFIRCPHCREMIAADSGQCRFCGVPFTQEQALGAARAQAVVESAIRQAQGLKYGGWAALIFAAVEVYGCVLDDSLPVRFLILQLAPPIGVFTSLHWLRRYGALQTDERDYPEAKSAMHRTTTLWIVMFVLQFVLLAVLVIRILAG